MEFCEPQQMEITCAVNEPGHLQVIDVPQQMHASMKKISVSKPLLNPVVWFFLFSLSHAQESYNLSFHVISVSRVEKTKEAKFTHQTHIG